MRKCLQKCHKLKIRMIFLTINGADIMRPNGVSRIHDAHQHQQTARFAVVNCKLNNVTKVLARDNFDLCIFQQIRLINCCVTTRACFLFINISYTSTAVPVMRAYYSYPIK